MMVLTVFYCSECACEKRAAYVAASRRMGSAPAGSAAAADSVHFGVHHGVIFIRRTHIARALGLRN
jgi:hypothetical protein